MAAIGEIRKRSGLLITVIGVAMALFILSDLLGQGGGNFFRQTDDTVGEIDGEEISQLDFEQRVEIEESKIQGAVDAQTREQIRSQVWGQMLQEKLLIPEFDKVGITVTPEEMVDGIQNNTPDVLARQFRDPQTGQVIEQFRNPQTGQLDGNKVLQQVQSMMANPETEAQWVPIERAIRLEQLNNKYSMLITKGMQATTFEAKQALTDDSKAASFNYAVKYFREIPDEEIEVSESDLKSYFSANKNKPEFQATEDSRQIKYVMYNVNPTPEDIDAIKAEMAELSVDFKTTENDTDFVVDNSDIRDDIKYSTGGRFQEPIDSIIHNADSGFVYGPFQDGEFYRIAKVTEVKFAPDSARARHILVETKDGDTATSMATADSLKQVIQNGGDFAQLAQQFSADVGSATKGGDLDYFTEGQMVPSFNDAVFEGETGDMPIVASQFGVHLIEITDLTAIKRKTLLSVVSREITPSEETFDNVYQEASSFSINNSDADAFDEAYKTAPSARIGDVKETDKQVVGVPNSRELILWAFKAENAEVSKAFEFDRVFVIAKLDAIKEKGTLPLNAVEDAVREAVIKEKKAEKIIAEIGGKTEVSDITAIAGFQSDKVEAVNFSSYSIPGIGNEGKVMGAVFSMQNGQTSKPIIGNEGVYVVNVNSLNDIDIDADFNSKKQEMTQRNTQMANFQIFESLQEAKGVKDSRARFY